MLKEIKKATRKALKDMKKKDGRRFNGGARITSGRHKVEDKKETIILYIRKSVIEGNGGKDSCRKDATAFLEKRAKRLSRNNSQMCCYLIVV